MSKRPTVDEKSKILDAHHCLYYYHEGGSIIDQYLINFFFAQIVVVHCYFALFMQNVHNFFLSIWVPSLHQGGVFGYEEQEFANMGPQISFVDAQ